MRALFSVCAPRLREWRSVFLLNVHFLTPVLSRSCSIFEEIPAVVPSIICPFLLTNDALDPLVSKVAKTCGQHEIFEFTYIVFLYQLLLFLRENFRLVGASPR